MNKLLGIVFTVSFLLSTSKVLAYTYKSTNEDNKNGTNFARPGVIGPHVNLLDDDIGEVTLEFVNPLSYAGCFEYRTDGDTSQIIADNPAGYPEPTRYSNFCLTHDQTEMNFLVNQYVEIRSAFGPESDWFFDWTRFDAQPRTVPTSMDQCKKGGWVDYVDNQGNTFKNQGQCVSFVTSKKHSPVLLETLEVDATTALSTLSSMTYEFGKQYLVTVEGTYVYWAGCPEYTTCIADANYSLRPTSSFGPGWKSLDGTMYSGYLKLKIDGESINWGDFNPEHKYSTNYTGTGDKIYFSILDSGYGDNSGSLTVNIYQIN